MERIEPTIGSFDLKADPAVAAQLRSAANGSRLRRAVLDWAATLFVLGCAFAVCAFLAWRTGVLPEQFQLGSPKLLERVSIVVGLAIAFLAQAVGCILVFRRSFVQGGLSLLVPGYMFLALRRNGLYVPVVGAWCLGLSAVVAGTFLLA
jgi:hypothetical protein